MKRLIPLMAIAALLCGCGNSKPKEPVSEEAAMAAKVNAYALPQVTDTVVVRYLAAKPEDYNRLDFALVVDYGGYTMDCAVWPLHNGYWLVNSHWCLEQMDRPWLDPKETPEYHDPFEGQENPSVHYSTVSCVTRNYGGETVNFYAAPESDEIVCKTDYKEITLHVMDADPKTRRLLVYTAPEDECWGEPLDDFEKEYRHKFLALKGWIDEEWVCGNSLTTCP